MGISTTDKYKRQQKYKDKYNRQIQRQIQKTNTKDKRQKTKDKRQKTKDKRQKTIPADDERMMVPLKSFNSITYKAYQKQLMLGLFLFSSLFITTMISGIFPAPKSKFAEATNTFLLNTFPPNLYLTHNCISTLRWNRKYFHILASNRRYQLEKLEAIKKKAKCWFTNWTNMFKCQVWTLHCKFQVQYCKSHISNFQCQNDLNYP